MDLPNPGFFFKMAPNQETDPHEQLDGREERKNAEREDGALMSMSPGDRKFSSVIEEKGEKRENNLVRATMAII